VANIFSSTEKRTPKIRPKLPEQSFCLIQLSKSIIPRLFSPKFVKWTLPYVIVIHCRFQLLSLSEEESIKETGSKKLKSAFTIESKYANRIYVLAANDNEDRDVQNRSTIRHLIDFIELSFFASTHKMAHFVFDMFYRIG